MDEALAKKIAERHGLVIRADDPISVLVTINDDHTERFVAQLATLQRNLFEKHKSEMELFSKRWSDEAKLNTEKVVNAFLASSKTVATNVIEDNATKIAARLQTEGKALTAELRQVAKTGLVVAAFSLTASLITFASVLLTLFYR